MTVSETLELPTRTRRRVWPWVLLGVALVLLVPAVVAVEVFGRGFAESQIEQQVRSALDVPDATPVEVELAGGSLLWQALSGRVDRVDITIDELALGPLTGDLTVVAKGVPLDQNAPTESLEVNYLVPESALAAIADHLSGVEIQDVALDGPEIVASGEVSLWVMTVPLALGLTPGAQDGALTFTPTSVRVGDTNFELAALADDPFWGQLARTITQTQSLCIADQLPKALTLTSVEVDGDELRIELEGSGAALGGSAFRTNGTCAA